jgi:hypothetical protein
VSNAANNPANGGGDQVQALNAKIAELEAQLASSNKFFPSADSIKTIGALVVVAIGVLTITVLAIATMAFIASDRDGNTIVPLSTAAFGVISTIVGAYLGVKIGTDQTRTLAESANQAHARLGVMQAYVPEEKREEANIKGDEAANQAKFEQ